MLKVCRPGFINSFRKGTGFRGCGKNRFLVIPTRSGGTPIVPITKVSMKPALELEVLRPWLF